MEQDLKHAILVARIESAILKELIKVNACPTCALKALSQVCENMAELFEQHQGISKEQFYNKINENT